MPLPQTAVLGGWLVEEIGPFTELPEPAEATDMLVLDGNLFLEDEADILSDTSRVTEAGIAER